MKFKKRVIYSVEYETFIEFDVDPNDFEPEEYDSFEAFVEAVTGDVVSDINIPEDEDSTYVECTFEPRLVEDIPVAPLEQLAESAE
jgi:hypothetical protein